MPVATPFNALGAGNGFTGCPIKVDVSQYTYYNTMTLEQAMSFFWNSYSVTMGATLSATLPEVFNGNVSNPTVDDRLFNGADQNPPGYSVGDREPVERVCSSIGSAYKREEDSINFHAVQVTFYGKPTPVRMYNGDTSNEANFVGYGLDGPTLSGEIAIAESGEDGGTVGSRTSLFSFAELSSDPFWWSSFTVMGAPDTVTNVTIGGIPFVKAEWTSFASPSQSTAITGIDLYTYP